MAHSTRTLRIVAASVVSLLMMGGTYALTGPNPFFGLNRIAEAQSSEELLREYAAKDTDTDGLPDWQEALYGTDPANPESFQLGIKDGEAVAQGLIAPKVTVRAEDEMTDIATIPGTAAAPNSLTDRFAQTLLTQYLQNRGENPPTSAEIVTFVEAGIKDLSASASSPDAFSSVDVRVSATGGDAGLRAYAAQVDAAFAQNTVPTEKNELSYFADALAEDARALRKIGEISQAYEDIANAMMRIAVPSETRQAHLGIANALMGMSAVTADMASMKEDPLRALMGIGLYEREGARLTAAFTNLSGIFSARQVVIDPSAPGYGTYYISLRAADLAQ
jgi:hypothetical protein